jgi:hypothetical protein
MLSFTFVLDRARQFIRHGLRMLASLVDDFLNASPDSTHEDNSYFSDDPYQPHRSNGQSHYSSLPWKTAGLATAGQFLINLLSRLPISGLLILAGGVAVGLIVTLLDETTWQHLRDKLMP